jgi:hypothetical protein
LSGLARTRVNNFDYNELGVKVIRSKRGSILGAGMRIVADLVAELPEPPLPPIVTDRELELRKGVLLNR